MPDRSSFDYAVLRIVPRVDREEFVNAGLVFFCLAQKFLHARVHIDEALVSSLHPDFDVEAARRHLEAFPRIAAGDSDSGPVALLSQRQRFHWLTAPRSTIIQVSPVHSGMCEDPRTEFDRLFQHLVFR